MKICKSKLEIALARKCWNQRRLRETRAVSSQTLSNINAGKDVLPGTVGKIARALGVEVTDILEEAKP